MMMRAFFAAMLSWVSVAHGQGFLGAGVDTNAVVVVTSNTTVNATHCGKTIEAGTGSTGFFTLTLPGVVFRSRSLSGTAHIRSLLRSQT